MSEDKIYVAFANSEPDVPLGMCDWVVIGTYDSVELGKEV